MYVNNRFTKMLDQALCFKCEQSCVLVMPLFCGSLARYVCVFIVIL
jgi:hypothetical protein